MITLTTGQVEIPLNNFTDHPYTLKRGSHVANFSVTTPGQIKYVKPINPVTTWHLSQDNPENDAFYVSSLITSSNPEDFKEKNWFPIPDDPGDPQQHTPVQKCILEELLNLQELEKLNPQDDPESRRHLLTNIDWIDSMLQTDEVARIEDLQVEFHDVFAKHRCDIGMNEEFTVQLTPRDDSPAYSQSLPSLSISRKTSM